MPIELSRRKTLTISTFGTEYNFFVKYLEDFQKVELIQDCVNKKCKKKHSVFVAKNFYFDKDSNNNIILNLFLHERCEICDSKLNIQYKFLYQPCWLFIESSPKEGLTVFDIPKKLSLDGKNFYLLCATFNSEAHFRAIFLINDEYLLVDDMKNKHLNHKIPDHKIVTSFYYLN